MIENGWTEYKTKAKAQWSKLTDEQIAGTAGKRDDLATQVQQAYAVTQGEAQRQISDWQQKQVEPKQADAPAAKQV
jgi:uncharacterized protein YjbJ (UPF0337 family)